MNYVILVIRLREPDATNGCMAFNKLKRMFSRAPIIEADSTLIPVPKSITIIQYLDVMPTATKKMLAIDKAAISPDLLPVD